MQRFSRLGSSVCLLGLALKLGATGSAYAGEAPPRPLDPYEVLDRLARTRSRSWSGIITPYRIGRS